VLAESLKVRRVTYDDPTDCAALLKLMDVYARDPMGGGVPLSAEVKERLCPDLSSNPSAISFIAWRDGDGKQEAIGLINCFIGYSTFKARPLLNIHDIVVLPECRSQGVGQALLAAAEVEARERGCCKLTLEILSGNTQAMASYARFGFEPYTLDPKAGQASFMHKWLSQEV
jgi:ribosomal protein S18 acetylase RimI-like enzyme